LNTQFHGVTSDPESARFLAERFYRFDPDWNRRFDPVYMSGFLGSVDIVDWIPVPFTVDEQLELRAKKFLDLQKFQFYARVSMEEGSLQSPIVKATIRDLDRDLYPDPGMVSQARKLLSQRVGVKVDEVVAEIEERLRNMKTDHLSSGYRQSPCSGQKSDIPAHEPVE
jgi:hypothetical protein